MKSEVDIYVSAYRFPFLHSRARRIRKVLLFDDDHDRALDILRHHFNTPNTMVTWVTNVEMCLSALYLYKFDEIWLDHDMDISDDGRRLDPAKQDGPQGMFVVDFLVRIANGIDTKESFTDHWGLDKARYMRDNMLIRIHSSNDEKAPEMKANLEAAGYKNVTQLEYTYSLEFLLSNDTVREDWE